MLTSPSISKKKFLCKRKKIWRALSERITSFNYSKRRPKQQVQIIITIMTQMILVTVLNKKQYLCNNHIVWYPLISLVKLRVKLYSPHNQLKRKRVNIDKKMTSYLEVSLQPNIKNSLLLRSTSVVRDKLEC